MKIKSVTKVISGASYIQSCLLGIMWFRGESTELNGVEISNKELYLRAGFQEGIFATMSPTGDIYEIISNGIRLQIPVDKAIGYPVVGVLPDYYILNKWDQEKDTYIYRYIQNGETLWTKSYPYRLIEHLGDFALLWASSQNEGSSCQLIDLSTGSVLWELDHPGAYISQVYPYEDKVIIVWFRKPESKSKNRVLCVEVPSGKVLWENDAAREYKKYGNNKLVRFYVHYWEDGNDDRDLYTELNVHTGEVYTRRYLGYNANVFVTTIYKDYLFYGAEKGGAYVGAINLRTYEMLPEVKVDFTPGDFNQIASIGVHDGQLYVEIQTELNHSDIHVFDLEEE